MSNKEDLKKQVIILSIVLVFVIIVAIFLNTRDSKTNKNNINVQVPWTEITTNNTNKENLTQEEKMKENLKGLLEEPDEDYYLQEELNDKNETVVTTKSGETIIIKD